MTFGEICEGKDYLSAAAGHLAASSVELIDPLYQYLDLQTLIEKIYIRLAESYSIQSVRFERQIFQSLSNISLVQTHVQIQKSSACSCSFKATLLARWLCDVATDSQVGNHER